MTQYRTRTFAEMAAILLAAILSVSCHPEEAVKPEITLRIAEADYKVGNQFVAVTAEGDWTLAIDFHNSGADANQWAYLGNDGASSITGSGSRRDIVLNWARNLAPESRTITLTLDCNGKQASCEFKQNGVENSYYQELPDGIKSDPVHSWMELPATDDKAKIFITHYMNQSGHDVRNYSYYWDTTALVAHWVAYPLNVSLIGNGSRSDEWGLDPKLPRRYQPVLFRAYNDAAYGFDGWYNRGHQCPSADRLSYEANVQTFYGTNMTPQMSELNAAAWGVLEGMVRTWARQFDTLYVVTGCSIKGSTETVLDNDGKKVTVPVGYYKALLGYKKNGTVGMTDRTGGYTGTAFWFDHKAYSGSSSVVMAQRCTIDQLEQKTGVDFFVNLPARIGDNNAATVESTIDSWWR